MKHRIKKMGPGDILDNTFFILRDNFWHFQWVNFFAFLPALLAFLAMALITGLFIWLVHILTGLTINDSKVWEIIFNNGLLMISGIAALILVIIAGIIFVIFLIKGTIKFVYGNIKLFHWGLHNQKITTRTEILAGLKGKQLRFFLFYFVVGTILSIFPSLFNFGLVISEPAANNNLSLIMNLGFYLSSIIQMIISFLICLAPVVLTLEDFDFAKSITRAFKMLAKHRWRAFGIILLTYLLGTIFYYIAVGLIILVIVIPVSLAKLITINTIGGILLFGTIALILLVCGLILTSIVISYYFGPLTSLYYDLKVRKEGYDLKMQISENEETEEKNEAPLLNSDTNIGNDSNHSPGVEV